MGKGLPKRICLFGHYDRFYARNRVLRKAFERNGIKPVEACSSQKGLRRYAELLLSVRKKKFDVLMVLFPGHTDMLLAWLISKLKKTPLVFDVFTSLYDSNVFDRSIIAPHTTKAKVLFYIDKIACHLADVIIVDTHEHANYFHAAFSVPRSKLKVIPVGADEEYMYPRNDICTDTISQIFFYGSYIPLQGIEHILDAASILQNQNDKIFFTLVGSGQMLQAIKKKAEDLSLRNVRFTGRVPYEKLPELIAQAHICLGIFGTSEKASRVVPNKVFDALAMRKPVITRDSPAMREWFEHGKNVWLIPPGNGKALADAILFLSENKEICARLSRNGYALFREKFSVKAISEEVKSAVLDWIACK